MVHAKRHIVKTISWQIIGTINKIIQAGIITGNARHNEAGHLDTISLLLVLKVRLPATVISTVFRDIFGNIVEAI